MSKTVELSEICRDVAKYIRQVEAGEEFIITEDGRPAVKLSPATPRPPAGLDQAGLTQASRKPRSR